MLKLRLLLLVAVASIAYNGWNALAGTTMDAMSRWFWWMLP